MATKATVSVGFTSSTLDNYRYWNRRRLVGADIKATDGIGNTIEVSVREGPNGYRVTLNGKTISTSFE